MNYIRVTPNKSRIKRIRKILRMISGNGYIIGGYARYCCSKKKKPETPQDIDIYSITEQAFEALRVEFDKEFTLVKESEVSCTYKWKTPLNLIKPVLVGAIVGVGEPETILNSFDFTVAKACIMSEDKAVVHELFHDHDAGNLLVIEHIHCPVSAVYRIMKYYKKGYWVRPIEVLKLFFNWDNRDDEYRSKLIEFIQSAEEFHKSGGEDKLSEEEIQELERMMFID